jgi:hypothetical protein
MKEFTIIISGGGQVEISLRGYEKDSPTLAKEIEDALGGKVQKVDWRPKQHINSTVKHGR